MRIVHMTDPHFIAPGLTDNGEYFTRIVTSTDGKVMLYSEPLLQAFVSEMLALAPDAVVISGDLSFNGAGESHRALSEMLRALPEAGIPVFVLPGNHDVGYSQAARFSGSRFEHVHSPTASEFEAIWQGFGYGTALSRDGASLSYTADVGDVRLLMLDINTEDAPGRIKEETIAWARAQLLAAKRDGRRVLSFSHQTLLRHNSLFEKGFRMENADALLRVLQGNTLLHLSGHMHIQHIASRGALTEITGSSLAVSPCQYGILTLDGKTLSYETRRTDVAGWAAGNAVTDKNLLHFPTYSASFFANSTVRQASSIAKEEGGKAALIWMATANLAYFSGNLTKIEKNDAALALIAAKLPFWSVYFNSILPDLGKDYTKLTLVF